MLDGGWSNSCGKKAFNLKGLDLGPNRKRISLYSRLETCAVWVGGDGLTPGIASQRGLERSLLLGLA